VQPRAISCVEKKSTFWLLGQTYFSKFTLEQVYKYKAKYMSLSVIQKDTGEIW